jgi:hypothetical protein
MREQIKKQLLESFDISTDSSSNFTSEQLATEIENIIFEKSGKDSKSKPYREKTKRIISRVKGTRNQVVRNVLKSGIFTVEDLCKMTDKELEDDNYFNKFSGEKEQTKGKTVAKPPKINIPIVSVDINNKGIIFVI